MLKNYLKVALRIILRHKGYSLINITGLAIGMACCIVVWLYVGSERGYDTYHQDAPVPAARTMRSPLLRWDRLLGVSFRKSNMQHAYCILKPPGW
jgi:hypothetical protein